MTAPTPDAVYLPMAYPKSEDWHEQRRLGIGGSDASTIMGFNRYENVIDLWRLKRGETGPTDRAETEAMRWGTMLEPTVADALEAALQDNLDSALWLRHPEGTLQNNTRPYLLANLDRLVMREDEGLVPVAGAEIKTVGAWGARDWEDPDGIATHALWQVVHYMAVTGLPTFHLGCLIAGQKFIWRTLHRQDDLEQELLEAEDRFWGCVESGEPPEPTQIGDARRLWPLAHEGEVVDLDAEAGELLADRRRLDAFIKECEAERKRVDEGIQRILGEAEAGLINGDTAVRWTNVTSTRLDTSALKKDQPEIAAKYAKTTTTRRFSVVI